MNRIIKLTAITIVALLCRTNTQAQGMEFSKKGGEIKMGDKVIALFEDEKKGFGNFKDFHLLSTTKTPLLDIKAESFKDTTDSPYETWFRMTTPDNATNFTVPMPAELNNYKAFASFIIDKKILNEDGTLNQDNLKNIAGDYKEDFKVSFDKRNDSIKKLVMIPTEKAERRTSRPVKTDEYEVLEQDGKVIGEWDYYSKLDKITGRVGEEVYNIKNRQGGIVMVARRDATGIHIHIFGGKKRKTEWISNVSDALYMKENQDKIEYARLLGEYAAKNGIL